jgi:hypothetical protein
MDRHPFTDDIDAAAGADSLLASTLFLLVRHAAAPCPRLAYLVERHLAAVAAHAGCGILVRETCRRLMAESAPPLPECPLGFAAPPCQGKR